MNTNSKLLAAGFMFALGQLALAQPVQIAGTSIAVTGHGRRCGWPTVANTDSTSACETHAALSLADVGNKVSGSAIQASDADMLNRVPITNS